MPPPRSLPSDSAADALPSRSNRYAQVIIEYWRAFTGREAVKLDC
jgi:hypothetical protein